MSNNVVFTGDEQVQIQELNNSILQFDAYKNLLLRSQHKGEDAMLVVQSVKFFEEIIKQTSAQLEALRTTAAKRSLAPKAQESGSKKKKGK